MSKPPLGKGLADLMNDDGVAGKPRAANISVSEPARNPPFGRGLTTLVSAHRSNGEPEQPAPKRRELLPTWFFFAADLLLLAFVVGITFDAPRPFAGTLVIFCAVAVAAGCLLSIVGISRTRN